MLLIAIIYNHPLSLFEKEHHQHSVKYLLLFSTDLELDG